MWQAVSGLLLLIISVHCTNLVPGTASYFPDGVNAADIFSDGTIVFCGTTTSPPGNVTVFSGLINNTNGFITLLNAAGTSVLGSLRIGTKISDCQVFGSQIAVIGESGGVFAAVLQKTGSSLTSVFVVTNLGASIGGLVAARSDGNRIAADGTWVAASVRGKVYFYSNTGLLKGSWDSVRTTGDSSTTNLVGGYNIRVEDIAIDGTSRTIYVAGSAQRCSNYVSGFLSAWSFADNIFTNQVLNGTAQNALWRNFQWWCSAVSTGGGFGGDMFGYRVRRGESGLLYFTGRGNGASQYQRFYFANSSTITWPASYNLGYDTWSQLTNVGNIAIAYYAEIQATGTVTRGQFVVARNPSTGAGANFFINDIAADSSGRVLIGGSSNNAGPDRANSRINGVNVAAFNTADAYLIETTSNWSGRTQALAVGTGNINAVATRNGVKVVVGRFGSSTAFITTANALFPTAQGPSSNFFIVY